MKNKPARLKPCNSHEVLETQLTITVKQLLFIVFLVTVFVAFCFIAQGPTYGYL